MKVTCSGCGKKYVIPDEKIPYDKIIKYPCAKCKTIIEIKKEMKNTSPEKKYIIGDELMKKIIKTSKAMPPMPQIMAKATEVMSDDTKGFKEIGEVLETDQAMATRVLKIANSAYYGLSIPVSSVQQASALLGCQSLLELITVVSTSKIMGKSLSGYGLSSEKVWKHSLLVATCSKTISDLKFPAVSNDAFNAGLIHDSGMIILDEYVNERKEMFENIKDDEISILNAETNAFGFDHAVIASEFFKKWKLPKAQTNAIKFHHSPSKSEGDTLSYILHAADSIVRYGPEFETINNNSEKGTFEYLKMSKEEVENIYNSSKEAVENIISSMNA